VPATKLNLAQTDRLEIVAAALTDALGRPLDGNDEGQPGSNFAATFGKHGIAFAQPSIRVDQAESAPVSGARRASNAEIIDALLERGELADLRRALHTSGTDA
jgi:hypothetical protein